MSSLKNAGRLIAPLALVIIAVLSTALPAQAEMGWVGGMFGMSIPNADSTTSRMMYGITGGAKLGTEWGVGGYYMTSTKSEDINGSSADFGYDLYGVEFAYHFEGEAAGVFLGGRLGTSKVKAGSGVSAVSISPMHYGPIAGFNRMIIEGVSLGGDVSYLMIDKGTSGGQSVAGFGTLNFLATAKFWF